MKPLMVGAGLVLTLALGFSHGSTSWASPDDSAGEWVLPKELTPEVGDTPGFYKKSDVCNYVHQNAPGKSLAIVAIKSHDCDFGLEKLCLKESYYLADPCNRAIQENFETFELRLLINSRRHGTTTARWSPENRPQFVKQWGPNLEPSWVIVDTDRCRILGRILRKDLHTIASKGWPGSQHPSAHELGREYTQLERQLTSFVSSDQARRLFRRTRLETQTCLATRRVSPSVVEFWDEWERAESGKQR